MEIGERLYIQDRAAWRSWLADNHLTKNEIWLIYYNKQSGKPRIPYNDAVEEALCYGWIDSILKPVDKDCHAQRFSPRRKNSQLSELNKERIRRLIKEKKMMPIGLESIKNHLKEDSGKLKKTPKEFEMPDDILNELKSNPIVWKNFTKFPKHYQNIRVAWIDVVRKRPEEFEKRLRYFIKMTAKNKKYGMVQ